MCTQSNMINDGFCNDETNNAECDYDGGDCCGSCVLIQLCSECACLGNSSSDETPNPLIGDGYCNTETNNLLCYFDGLDCCQILVDTDIHSEHSACHGKIEK